MDDMFDNVDPENVTAGEFMERLTQEVLDNDGVAHIVQRVQDQNGEETVLVLHVGLEAVLTPEEFEGALNEARNAETGDDPVVQ